MPNTMRLFLSFLFSSALLFSTFSANALSGIPNGYTVAGKPLVLNGAGARTKFVITVYHAGLYLQKKNANAQQIISANEPMAIRLKITSGFASAEKMKSAINEGFHNATGGKTAPIKQQINQLLVKGFSAKINKGDVFDLVYTPAGGTQLIKNNKPVTAIKGLPFKQALFGIWLSNKPAQGSLKSELLGKASSSF